jgi:hypothetical protein
MRDQAIRTCRHGVEQAMDLLAGEHRGEPLGPVSTVKGTNVAEFHAEHLFVEEDQGAV